MGITNNRDSTRTQAFTYDQVNRIVTGAASTYSQSSAHCWGETYTYDQWANMSTIGAISSAYTGCTQDNLSVSVTTNNQLSSTGFSYDLAGNMTGDNTYTYGYNAESEIKSAAGVNYTYDGDGNRLEKSNGKLYWYGAGTEILDESDLSGNFTNEYVFFGGRRIAIRNVSSGTIDYYEEDMLGSSRTMVQAGGTSPCFDADFLPFGYEKDVTTTCTQNYKFEGKERDTETSNDDFGARYYTFRLGRWLSADWSSVPAPVPYANLANPQTLNLYAMVSDNPESFADLDGHGPTWAVGAGNDGSGNDGITGLQGGCVSSALCEMAAQAAAEETQMEAQSVAEAQAEQTAKQQSKAQKPKPKPKSKQLLKFNTINGGQGSRAWVIQWQLSQESKKGGWIVQQISLTNTTGKQVLEYWEAWEVSTGSQFTVYHGIGSGADDTFSAGMLSHLTATASARFYEGLDLPASFIANNPDTLAGRLRSTTANPNLPTNAATDSVDRTWTSPYQ